MAGADATAIFVVVPIDDVVAAIFDTPVSAVGLEQALRVGLLGGSAGDAVSGVVRGFAAFLVDGVTFDEVGLRDVGEIEIVVEGSGSPDLTRLDASMIGWVNGEEVGCLPILEVAYEILMQRGLIAFDGEVIVGAALVSRGNRPTSVGSTKHRP